MPWYVVFLINLAIKVGIPELEKVAGPALAALIKSILEAIQSSPAPTQTVRDLSTHFEQFSPPKTLPL